jgi:hypothetical protein
VTSVDRSGLYEIVHTGEELIKLIELVHLLVNCATPISAGI